MPPEDYTRNNDDRTEMRFTLKVDGVSYRFDLSNITAAIELDLYRQSGGLKLTQVVQEIMEAPAGFHIAALVFLCRRSEGHDVTFDQVAGSLGLSSEIEIVMDDDADEDAPKAFDGN